MTYVRTNRPKINASVRDQLRFKKARQRDDGGVSIEDVRRMYSLPASLGTSQEHRVAMDDAFGSCYDMIQSSLTQHALDLGQYPMSGFVGYAVLQSIAQNGMIRACIQTVADEMTREFITVTGGEDTDDKVIERLNDKLEARYHLRTRLNRALSVMGYMGGSFLFIDTGAEDTSLPLALNERSAEFSRDRHVRFVVIDPICVSPCKYNSIDPLKEDYMKPRSWLVMGKEVHASRLVKFVDNTPPILLAPAYNFLGIPQAQILWDYVLHWNKSRVSACGLLEKMNLMVFKTDAMQYLGNADGLEQLDAKVSFMSRYRDNDSVFVCDNETEGVENVTQTITGATDISKQALEFVASINRTPAVKLLGISPSGFNATGESDLRNYYDHIRAKQEKFRDAVMKCLKAVQLSEFGKIDPRITFEWNELGKEDETQKIGTAVQKAQMLTTLQGAQAISAEEVRALAKADESMGLDSLEDEMPPELQQQMQQQMQQEGEQSPYEDQIRQALAGGEQGEEQGAEQNATPDRSERGQSAQVQEAVI